MMKIKYHPIIFLLILLVGWGCASKPELPPEPTLEETRSTKTLSTEDDESLWGGAALTRDTKQVIQSRMDTLSAFQDEYKIGPSDIIEIIYNFRYELTPDEYILEVQDDLSIDFLFNPELSRKVRVRMDGKITLPLVGEVVAAEKTAVKLHQDLTQKYIKYIKNPNISVVVVKGNIKIEELKKAITTAARGQSKIVPVRPDGRITLPLIGDVQAAGLTVPELRYEVNRQYAKLVRNLDTTVILKQVRSPKVYVMGEVIKPGGYETPQPVTAMQAIAMAGGLKETANADSVVVLRDIGLPVPKGIRLDIEDIFDLEKSDLAKEWEERRKRLREKLADEGKQDMTQDVYAEMGDWNFIHNDLALHRNDIIYVPKTFIAGVDKFINQWFTKGLYSALPEDSTMGFILDTWDVIHIDERRTYRVSETDTITTE